MKQHDYHVLLLLLSVCFTMNILKAERLPEIRSTGEEDTLTAAQAIAKALENNYSILLAKSEAQIAANNNTAGNAGLLPEVNADISQTYTINNTQQKFFSGIEKEGTGARSNVLSARVQLNWTIFDGFSMFVNRDKLAALQELGETGARRQIESMISAVLMVYFDLVEHHHALSIMKEAMDLSHERLKLAQARAGLGSASELMVLQALVDYNADSSAFVDLLTQIGNLKADLNVLLARDPATRISVAADFSLNAEIKYEEVVNEALRDNPDIRKADLNTRLSTLNIREASSAYFPSINLLSSYNYGKSEFEIGTLTSNRSYGITYGISANWNIFNGFTKKINRKNALISKDMADADYQLAELTIRADILKLYNSYTYALSKVNMEQSNLEAARRTLKVAYENYKMGGISDIDLRATQLKQMEAESRMMNARLAAKQAEISLLQMSGSIMKVNW